MKYLIASDIHGSAYYAKAVAELLAKENADMLILLGDIYNHGPRNPLPKEYAPLEVAKILNGLKEKMIVIKGNCDSEVDTYISEFDFLPHMMLVDGGKKIFLTHGHVYNEDNMPKTAVDALIYGHFHTGMIKRNGETLIANPGSTSLPKDNLGGSYIVLENGVITLKKLDGSAVSSEKI